MEGIQMYHFYPLKNNPLTIHRGDAVANALNKNNQSESKPVNFKGKPIS